MALLAGAAESVRAHLGTGASPDATDAQGRSALMLALSRGHIDVCRLLLEAGADPTTRDKTGNDALTMARARGETTVEELLQRAQASLAESRGNDVDGHRPNSNPPSGRIAPSLTVPGETLEQVSAQTGADTVAAALHQRESSKRRATSYRRKTTKTLTCPAGKRNWRAKLRLTTSRVPRKRRLYRPQSRATVHWTAMRNGMTLRSIYRDSSTVIAGVPHSARRRTGQCAHSSSRL